MEALLPAPVGVDRFVIRATRERGVGVPSSRSLATASREANPVYGGCLRMGMAPSRRVRPPLQVSALHYRSSPRPVCFSPSRPQEEVRDRLSAPGWRWVVLYDKDDRVGNVVSAHWEGNTPVRVGSLAAVTRRVGPRTLSTTEEITELSPPKSWKVRGVGGPTTAIAKGTIEPLDDGARSRVTIAFGFEAQGVGKLLPSTGRPPPGAYAATQALGKAEGGARASPGQLAVVIVNNQLPTVRYAYGATRGNVTRPSRTRTRPQGEGICQRSPRSTSSRLLIVSMVFM